MPLFKMDLNGSGLDEVKPHTLKQAGIQERQNLQRLLRDNPQALNNALGEDLFIIYEEYNLWDCDRRVDLLAIDKGDEPDGNGIKTANLVVIELKRDEDGSHMELQSIRYAAMLSNLNFEDVLESFSAFTKIHASKNSMVKPSNVDEAQRRLLAFLGVDDLNHIRISRKPRIILINSDFNPEITSAVMWLNDECDLDIQCLKGISHKSGNDLFLDLKIIIPLPEAKDYMVGRHKKTQKETKQISVARAEKSISVLFTRGMLKPQDRLRLIKSPKSGLELKNISETDRKATVISEHKIRWDADGQDYSLSGLCKEICLKYGMDIGKGAFQGPGFWAKEGQDKSLAEIAKMIPSK